MIESRPPFRKFGATKKEMNKSNVTLKKMKKKNTNETSYTEAEVIAPKSRKCRKRQVFAKVLRPCMLLTVPVLAITV